MIAEWPNWKMDKIVAVVCEECSYSRQKRFAVERGIIKRWETQKKQKKKAS